MWLCGSLTPRPLPNFSLLQAGQGLAKRIAVCAGLMLYFTRVSSYTLAHIPQLKTHCSSLCTVVQLCEVQCSGGSANIKAENCASFIVLSSKLFSQVEIPAGRIPCLAGLLDTNTTFKFFSQ